MTPVGTQRYAVGLYRVSTAEQGHSGLGLEAQQAAVRAFAVAQGWTLVAEFFDIASGKDDRRPGFQAHSRGAASLVQSWPRPGWIALPVGPTRSRNYWRMVTRSARRTHDAHLRGDGTEGA